jgi:hypothetical protein
MADSLGFAKSGAKETKFEVNAGRSEETLNTLGRRRMEARGVLNG